MKTIISTSENNRVVYQISGCTQTELDNKINNFFFAQGYKPHSSQEGVKTYTKGDKTMRVFFGALVNYFKQDVLMKKEENGFSIILPKSIAGISGGLIGKNQVKTEFKRLNEALETYLAQPPS